MLYIEYYYQNWNLKEKNIFQDVEDTEGKTLYTIYKYYESWVLKEKTNVLYFKKWNRKHSKYYDINWKLIQKQNN